MSRSIMLGIDLARDFTQIAYVDVDGIPVSVCVGTADNFLIPTAVCYNSDLDEWSAGDEALNKSRLQNSTTYRNLTGMIDDPESENIVKHFMSYLLKLAFNYCNGRLVRKILVSIEDVSPGRIEGLKSIFKDLGYDSENIRILSRSESFVYYVLNQSRDIWINKVYYADFTREGFYLRRMTVTKGRKPYVVNASLENLSSRFSLDMAKNNPDQSDVDLAEFFRDEFRSNVVSAVFLSGEGFYTGEWSNTIETLCENRRVFKGNNLIVKGAAYAAKELFLKPELSDYVISCKGRTRARISLETFFKGQDTKVVLSDVGDYWYQAGSTVECIVKNPSEAVFEVQNLAIGEKDEISVDLSVFPKRPPGTTRIQVSLKYDSETLVEIRIKDLGFGEFYEASDIEVIKRITIKTGVNNE